MYVAPVYVRVVKGLGTDCKTEKAYCFVERWGSGVAHGSCCRKHQWDDEAFR